MKIYILSQNGITEYYDSYQAAALGAQQRQLPTEIIQEQEVLSINPVVDFCSEVTNKELRDLLEQYPDNAKVAIEYCNPRRLEYDKEHNIIKID